MSTESQQPDEEGDTTDPGSSSSVQLDVAAGSRSRRLRTAVPGLLVSAVLPALALILTLGAGWLKWHESTIRAAEAAGIESIQAATESTIALLSYRPETADRELVNARDRLTGEFRKSYSSLVEDVVIPGAKEKQISSTVEIPAAASVSADEHHAVVLVFVNQTTVVGVDAPTQTASSVRVTLDKVDGKWLISDFTPV